MNVHDEIAVRFRANLKAWREKRNLSQHALALRMEISTQYVYQLEKGIRSPSLDMIRRTAHALSVDPAALLREIA